MFFTVSLMATNCLGMTPLPYRPGILSKSILMANQFVIPPANEKRPKDSRYFSTVTSGAMLYKTMPRSMQKKAATLLTSPMDSEPNIEGVGVTRGRVADSEVMVAGVMRMQRG